MDKEDTSIKFSFGKNWRSYSQSALTPERIEQARNAFRELLGGIEMQGKKFIDIGFGQGLSLVAAAEMGADVLGVEADKKNIEALNRTRQAMGYAPPLPTRIISILDDAFVKEYNARFDIVHSWGTLHHTGDMAKAIRNACALVAENGYLVCSIYNRHWSSPVWRIIKFLYNKLPGILRRAYTSFFCAVIYLAKLVVTRENPKKKERGMDFFHDVVDWVGGYPYEYADKEEIKELVGKQGFLCIKYRSPRAPTGCNEFVFKRIKG